MFGDQNIPYTSNNHSARASYSVCPSVNSSISSDGSNWDSSSAVATPLHTPNRPDFDFIKLEDSSLSALTPSSAPQRYGTDADICSMSSMSEEMLSGFQDPTMIFSGKLLSDQALMGYNNFSTYVGPSGGSFGNHSRLSLGSQSLDSELYSPISDMGPSLSEDFVNPSQTTFMDTFDMESPMRPVRSLQFDTQYETQNLDYDSGFEMGSSPAENMQYCMPSYNESRSCSTTPSRPSSLRQPVHETLQTSTALHLVQEETPAEKQAQASRHSRRQTKKERREAVLPHNIRVEKLACAKKPCLFPGCDRKFRRQEHLKRHQKTHTKSEIFPCPFCNHPFGRSDNLKSHIKLHAAPPKKSARTDHFSAAIEVYESMTRKSRKSGNIKSEEEGFVQTRSRLNGH